MCVQCNNEKLAPKGKKRQRFRGVTHGRENAPRWPLTTTNVPSRILTINGGLSSLKFALFERNDSAKRLLAGRIERIGLNDSRWVVTHPGDEEDRQVDAPNQQTAAGLLIDWLERTVGLAQIAAVGHRVVHGGSRYHQPERVTADLIVEPAQDRPVGPGTFAG